MQAKELCGSITPLIHHPTPDSPARRRRSQGNENLPGALWFDYGGVRLLNETLLDPDR